MSIRFKKTVTVICVVLAMVGFLNFCIFLTLHDLLGGEAHHIENGHYFSVVAVLNLSGAA